MLSVVNSFGTVVMSAFVGAGKKEIIEVGVTYLRIEGACYIGIGVIFMLYGYYRAVNIPKMSLILTIISLGTRVLLAYTLPKIAGIGVIGIWVAIPIGWLLADVYGIRYYLKRHPFTE